MGLTSLWSNITGPKVKEITPQPQCSWLEKNRPKTSASTRKKIPHLQLKPDETVHNRPTTSHDAKRKKRGLSISRPKLLEESKRERKASGTRGSGNVPDVPAPPAAPSRDYRVPTEDITRPGTALTTDGSVSTTERFELPGDGLPSPRFQSPLPSPLSPTYPTSPKSHMTTRSQEPADAPEENGGGLRKRSNSTASGKPKLKCASWFVDSKQKAAEAELPPPLPPPPGPPPKPPLIQSISTQVPDAQPPLGRRNSSADVIFQTPLSAATENSLDSDSILNAFPSVPAVNTSKTSEANTRTSATSGKDAVVSQSIPTGDDPGVKRQSPPSSSATNIRPRPIAVPTPIIDGILLAPETPKETPRRDSKQLPPFPAEATTIQTKGDSKALSFSEELQQEYDRLMEVMGEQPNPGAVMRVFGELDFKTQSVDDVQKFSNDEALAKLEFGILK